MNNIKSTLNKSSKKIERKILDLDINRLNVSNYFKKNILYRQNNIKDELKKYSFILTKLLTGNQIPLEKYVLVDYGAGYGILGLLAKEMGIGTVIYNDIYDGYAVDFIEFSNKINMNVDHVHVGDLDDLNIFLLQNKLQINGLISYDVLEHIYDLNKWVKSLSMTPSQDLIIIKGSGANPKNPNISLTLMLDAYYRENNDREFKSGDNEIDCYESYLGVRKKIIKKKFDLLDEISVNLFARLTRGMIEDDIVSAINLYLDTNTLPKELSHPTNTCNPYTGSWDEHLINFEWLLKLFENYGFTSSINPGIYHKIPLKISLSTAQMLYYNYLIKSKKRNRDDLISVSPFYFIKASLIK